MTKISLATYTITCSSKIKKDEEEDEGENNVKYYNLDNLPFLRNLFNFEKRKHTIIDFFKNIFDENDPGFIKHEKAITIKNYIEDEKELMIHGTLHYGTYGAETPVYDLVDGKFSEKEVMIIKKKQCATTPYYFLIKIPRGRKEGLIIFEKKGTLGVKIAFINWINEYIKSQNYNVTIDITSFIPKKVIKQFVDKGSTREIRFIKSKLPSDEIEILRGYSPEEGYCETKYVFPKKTDKITKIPSKIKKLILNENSTQLNENDFDGDSPDDIKIKIDLEGTERTFTVSNPESAAPYRDITMDISKGDDGHPDFESINQKALDYAKEIFK